MNNDPPQVSKQHTAVFAGQNQVSKPIQNQVCPKKLAAVPDFCYDTILVNNSVTHDPRLSSD